MKPRFQNEIDLSNHPLKNVKDKLINEIWYNRIRNYSDIKIMFDDNLSNSDIDNLINDYKISYLIRRIYPLRKRFQDGNTKCFGIKLAY